MVPKSRKRCSFTRDCKLAGRTRIVETALGFLPRQQIVIQGSTAAKLTGIAG